MVNQADRRIASVYSGYLDVDDGAKHLFFYYFESRRNPDSGTFSHAGTVRSVADMFADDVMMCTIHCICAV
jgi:hypothetical protein